MHVERKVIWKKRNCCEKCKSAYYCSPECQKYDWENGHKENCKRMHKLRKYNKKGTKYSEIYELEDATKKYNKSLKAAKKFSLFSRSVSVKFNTSFNPNPDPVRSNFRLLDS